MCGSRPSGKYGLYDKVTIKMCDNKDILPNDVVFVFGDELVKCVENSTQKGIHYTAWLSEREKWLSFMPDDPKASQVIQSFDAMWQRIVRSFVTVSPIVRKPKGRKDTSHVQGEVAFAYDQEVQGALRDLKALAVCL